MRVVKNTLKDEFRDLGEIPWMHLPWCPLRRNKNKDITASWPEHTQSNVKNREREREGETEVFPKAKKSPKPTTEKIREKIFPCTRKVTSVLE